MAKPALYPPHSFIRLPSPQKHVPRLTCIIRSHGRTLFPEDTTGKERVEPLAYGLFIFLY